MRPLGGAWISILHWATLAKGHGVKYAERTLAVLAIGLTDQVSLVLARLETCLLHTLVALETQNTAT